MTRANELVQKMRDGLSSASEALPELATLVADGERCAYLVLAWTCETCGWESTVPVPGFAGDGFNHYPDGTNPCGPLVARRSRS